MEELRRLVEEAEAEVEAEVKAAREEALRSREGREIFEILLKDRHYRVATVVLTALKRQFGEAEWQWSLDWRW